MAQVNVDLSEYDMLRESKAKAEKELEEVKKELEGLKKHSSCVVKTRRYLPNLDVQKAARIAAESYMAKLKSIRFRDDYEYSYMPFSERDTREAAFRFALPSNPFTGASADFIKLVTSYMESSIKEGIREAHSDKERYSNSGYIEDVSLTEVIGFEDVRIEVENTLKEQYVLSMEEKKFELDRKITEYSNKLKKVTDEVEAQYKEQVLELKQEIAKLEKDKEELKKDLAEAKKTKEDKIAEAEEKVRLALQELEAIKGKQAEQPKKKGFLGLFQ